MITVLIADDHAAIRSGLRLMLSASDDLTVVGEAADGDAALTQARALRPDVTLMDVRMPHRDGIRATATIVAEGLSQVLMVTSFTIDDYVRDALIAGAAGYVLKTIDGLSLVDAVRRVAAGDAVLAPEVTRQVIDHYARASAPLPAPASDHPATTLTPREQEVLRGIARGLSNAELATELSISEATAKTHVSRVLGKMDCTSRVQAAIKAQTWGLG